VEAGADLQQRSVSSANPSTEFTLSVVEGLRTSLGVPFSRLGDAYYGETVNRCKGEVENR